jgi:polyisoprenyl-phosphate glycosyltransferase
VLPEFPTEVEGRLKKIVILIPIRDDWESVTALMRLLDLELAASPFSVEILLIDDASNRPHPWAEELLEFKTIEEVRVLRLRRNLGHQRAIALGLVEIRRSCTCDAVVVMDGDGEDTPEGVAKLLSAFDGKEVVFAERSRRTESLTFRVFYQGYRLLHRVLTGVSVRVGNFSVVPFAFVDRLVVMSELWNHYAAAIFRSGLPFRSIPIPRGYRIAGESKMNFVSLTAHGISAISVFGDVVGVRLLICSMIASVLVVLAMLGVVGIRLSTDLAIPGWATYSVAALAIILIQIVSVATSFTFSMLSGRINLSFVPLRDFEMFVTVRERVYSRDNE